MYKNRRKSGGLLNLSPKVFERANAGTPLARLNKAMEETIWNKLHELNEDAVLQLQQMLNTPIEDQAASYELNLLSSVLESGVHLLGNSESDQETCEILRQIIKSAFVIGRRHVSQLV